MPPGSGQSDRGGGGRRRHRRRGHGGTPVVREVVRRKDPGLPPALLPNQNVAPMPPDSPDLQQQQAAAVPLPILLMKQPPSPRQWKVAAGPAEDSKKKPIRIKCVPHSNAKSPVASTGSGKYGVFLAQPQQQHGEWRMVKTRDGAETSIFMKEMDLVGEGTFGKIVEAAVKAHGRQTENLALKVTREEERDLGYLETNVLLQLDHENIVGLKYYFEVDGNVNVLMELMEDGDLYHYIHQHYRMRTGLGNYTELFAYQIFRALAYLHSIGFAHRDIKPENILVSTVTGLCKVADFNCASKMSEKPEHSPRVGTKIYNAPELSLGSRQYDEKVDVWSAGVVFTSMICGRSVFLVDTTPYEREAVEPITFVMQYLGSPTENDFACMKVSDECRRRCQPVRKCKSFRRSLGEAPGIHDKRTIMDLIPHIFTYKVHKRLSAWQVCAHDVFVHLRNSNLSLPNGNPVPNVFSFTPQEVQSMDFDSRVNLVYSRGK